MIYNNNNEDIKKEYKKVLIDAGIKQGEIADKLKMNKTMIGQIFGKKNLGFKDLYKLLDAAGYDLEINFVKKVN